MSYVKYINKNIQETLKARERALGWKTSNSPLSSTNDGSIRPRDMNSRSVFVRMCSNKVNDVDNILIRGGEVDDEGNVQFGVGLGDRGAYKATTIGNRAIAGIKNIEVSYESAYGGFSNVRKATINWVVNSIDDLDRLTPYFLTLGQTVALDWGWISPKEGISSFYSLYGSPLFITENGSRGVNVNQDIFTDPLGIVGDIGGDYDAMGGKVNNFEYNLRNDGGFDCVTELKAIGTDIFSTPLDIDTGGIDIVRFDKSEDDSSDTSESQPSDEETGNPKKVSIHSGYDGFINCIINLESIINYNIYEMSYIPDNMIRNESRKEIEYFCLFGAGTSDTSDYINTVIERNKAMYIDNIYDDISTNTTTLEGVANYGIFVDDKRNPHVLTIAFPDFRTETFVTWGWMEDQLLNRYASIKGGQGEGEGVKMTIRSIDTMLDEGTSEPILTEEWLAKQYGIASAQIDEGIGRENVQQDRAQRVDFNKELVRFLDGVSSTNLNKYMKMPTQIRYSKLLYANDPLKFFIWDNLPEEDMIADNPKSKFFRKMMSALKSGGSELIDLQSIRPLAKHDDFNSMEGLDEARMRFRRSETKGLLRNIWVNIEEIQKAFGVNSPDSGTTNRSSIRPVSTIVKGLNNLLKELNLNFHDAWDFKLVLDPYDSTNLKIVDNNVSGVRGPRYTEFEDNSHKVKDNVGIYKFPSFKIGSIVKNQNLSFKVPDEIQTAVVLENNSESGGTKLDSRFNFSWNGMLGNNSDTQKHDKFLKNSNKSYQRPGDITMDPINIGSENTSHHSKITSKILGASPVIKTTSKEEWFKRWDPHSDEIESPAIKRKKKEVITKLVVEGDTIIVATEEWRVEKDGEISYQSMREFNGKEYVNTNPTEQSGVEAEAVFRKDIFLTDELTLYTISDKKITLDSDVRSVVRTKISSLVDLPRPLPADLSLEVDGVGGVVPGDAIHTDYIQGKYNRNVISKSNPNENFGPLVYFQIKGISQKVDNSGWTTEIETMMRGNEVAAPENAELTLAETDSPVKALEKTVSTNPTDYTELGNTTIPQGERLPFAQPLGEDGLPIENSTLFNQPLGTSGILSLSGPPTNLLTQIEPFRPISDMTDIEIIDMAFRHAENELPESYPDPLKDKPIFATPNFEYEPISRPKPKTKNFKKCKPIPADGIHIVASGDSLSKIAKDYCIELSKIVELNDIKDRNIINVGDKIKLRAPEQKITLVKPNNDVVKVDENSPVVMEITKAVNTGVDYGQINSGKTKEPDFKLFFGESEDVDQPQPGFIGGNVYTGDFKQGRSIYMSDMYSQGDNDYTVNFDATFYGPKIPPKKKEVVRQEQGVINAKKEKAPPIIDNNEIKKVEKIFDELIALGALEVTAVSSGQQFAINRLPSQFNLDSADAIGASVTDFTKYLGSYSVKSEKVGSLNIVEEINSISGIKNYRVTQSWIWVDNRKDSSSQGWYTRFGDILGK